MKSNRYEIRCILIKLVAFIIITAMLPIGDVAYGLSQNSAIGENQLAKPSDLYCFELPYLVKAQDAYSATPGIPLEFTRTFPQDSRSTPELGPLGYGWISSYDICLKNYNEGIIVFRGPDGGRQWFRDNGDGTYSTVKGDHSALIRDENGTFTLIEKGGVIYSFNSKMLIDFITDPNGNFIKAYYNSKDQLTDIKHSSGQSFHLEYDGFGRISRLIDQADRGTTYEYSPDGLFLQKVIASGGRVTSYTYGTDGASNHRLLNITFPDKTHKFFTYDSQGRLASEEQDDGVCRLTYSYDEDGTTRIKDPAGGETLIKVNDLGMPTEVSDPSGATTRLGYDSDFRLNKITDPLNHTSLLSYDNRSNVVQITDPSGNRTEFGYDPVLNEMTVLKDSLGRVTNFGYDRQGNLQAITYPDNSSEKFRYNKIGLLWAKTTRKGQVINYSFDDQGRILSKTYPDGNNTNFTYDRMGRLTKASNSEGAISFSYDSTDNLISTTHPGNRIFRYEYNSAAKRTKMTDPDGRILLYEYDKSGRLLRINDGTGKLVVEYQYDDANRRTKKTLGNGAYTTYIYDRTGQLLKVTNNDSKGNEISHFYYTYDADGNVLSKETIEGVEHYSYDALNQLTGIDSSSGSKTEIIYDSMGNRINVIENNKPHLYSVNELNQYTSIDNKRYEYDENGNLISEIGDDNSIHYNYDPENRLIGAKTSKGNVNYTYNPFGLRNSRTYSQNKTLYLWDSDQVAIEEEDANHRTIARYTFGDALDEAIQIERDGKTCYYVQDGLRSSSDLMDNDGRVLEHYRYDVFGKPLSKNIFDSPIMFSGASYDLISQIQFNRFRFYSPFLGRFMNQDPIGFKGGINLYEYVKNRYPIFTDPYGLFFPNQASEFLRGWLVAGFGVPEGDFAPGFNFFLWTAVGFIIANSLADPFGEEYYIYNNGNEGSNLLLSFLNGYKKYLYYRCNDPFKVIHWREMTYLWKNKQESILIPNKLIEATKKLGTNTGLNDLKKVYGDHESNNKRGPELNFNTMNYYLHPPDGGDHNNYDGGDHNNYDGGDQNNKWISEGFEPISKANSNNLNSASSAFTDTLKSSVGGAQSGYYALSVEKNKDTGEQRFTLYVRPITSSAETAWRPLSAMQAAVALASMGYSLPDSLDFTNQQIELQGQISDSILSIQQSSWKLRQEMNPDREQKIQRDWIRKIDEEAAQLLQSQYQMRQLDEVQSKIDQLQQKNQELGGVNFTSIQLNYISMGEDPLTGNKNFNFVLKTQSSGEKSKAINLKDASALSARSFLTGLSLPNNKFWVNLNPWEPNRITDADLSHTDVGRIMLEADLQMKKDFCKYEDPCKSKIGNKFWKLLGKKHQDLVNDSMKKYPGEIQNGTNVRFAGVTRHWIVPDKIKAYGSGDEIYIDNSTLNVSSEPVSEHSYYDIVNQDTSSISKECLEDLNKSVKIYGNYTKELEDQLILPLVVRDINSEDAYSELRQVYVSLALAQLCKERENSGKDIFSNLINSINLTGLGTNSQWSSNDVWKSYVKSYNEGEYRCWQNNTLDNTYVKDEYIITEMKTESKLYSAGGVDFSRIPADTTIIKDPTLKMENITAEAIYTPFAEDRGEYYFGDGIYVQGAGDARKYET